MELTFPANEPDPDPKPIKNGITILLTDKDRIFYYEGQFRAADDATGKKTELSELNFSQESLHKYLLEKNKTMQEKILALKKQFEANQLADTAYKRQVRNVKADKESYTFLIKTDDKATYKNVIDVIDELNINVVGKYVMVDMMQPELDLVNAKLATN